MKGRPFESLHDLPIMRSYTEIISAFEQNKVRYVQTHDIGP